MSTGLFSDEEDGYNIEEDTVEEETLEEETKYKLKISNSSPEPSGDDMDMGGGEDLDLGGEDLDMGDEDLDMGDEEESSDKPFDEEPFDADVEASEDDDPEKYIQQLSGKLGQTMRTHAEENDGPDYDLEKFAINSVISASHSADMDEEDQDDIIEKVKTSGGGSDEDSDEGSDEDLDMGDEEMSDEEPMDDNEDDLDLDLDESFNQDGEPYGFDNPSDDKSIMRQDLYSVLVGYAHDKGIDGYLGDIVDYLLDDPQVNGFERLNQANNMNYDQTFNELVSMGKAMISGRGFSGAIHEGHLDDPSIVEIGALYYKLIEKLEMATSVEELESATRLVYDSGKLSPKEIVALTTFHDSKKRELGGDMSGEDNASRLGGSTSSFIDPTLHESDKFSIFVKKGLKEMIETEPITKPREKEVEPERETRRKKTFSPVRPNPDPKLSGDDELILGDEQ